MRIDGALRVHTARRRQFARVAAFRVDASGRVGAVGVGEAFFRIAAAGGHRVADQAVRTQADEGAWLIDALRRAVARPFQALVDVLAFAADQHIAGRAGACGLVTFNETRAPTTVGVVAWICLFRGRRISVNSYS